MRYTLGLVIQAGIVYSYFDIDTLEYYGFAMSRKISIHNNNVPQEKVTLIKPRSGWQLVDWGELMEYRDLFYFLVMRNIKVLYAQTVLGLSWAIMQPLIQIVLFTVIFGKVASVPTDGIPYFLFSTVAIIPWTYMSQSMNESSLTLVTNQGMLGKIYFPRIILPTVPILAKLLDFAISILLLVVTMLYYRVYPTINIIYLPFFLLYMMLVPLGIGFFLSALAIRYRDVKYAMTFIVRLLIYTAPVVYSASSIPEKYRLLYSLNPIVGVIEGFRAAFLGGAMPWMFILPGFISAIIFLFAGAMYFRRMEHVFVDVI